MSPSLSTKRLFLKAADPLLAEELAAFYRRNQVFLAPFEPQRTPAFFTAPYQASLLKNEQSDMAQKTAFRFYLFLKDAPSTLIGSVGLNNIVYGAFCSCFLGYKLEGSLRGQGYMPEAVASVVNWAFTKGGLHRIEANIMPRNKPSLRVVEKCGFAPEGLAKNYLQINGVWEDHLHMVKRNEPPLEEAVS